jgi:putative transposase
MLYYEHKQWQKDWQMKQLIEKTLEDWPSYGHKRLADKLKVNKKRVLRVMHLFGIKPYRRRGRKPKKSNVVRGEKYPNLLKTIAPIHPNQIWVSDFTYIPYKERFLYLATTMDVFTAEIVGWSISTTHTSTLTLNALFAALSNRPRPKIHHCDNGREYTAKSFVEALLTIGTSISRSKPGCPWENGYQESFYSQFKVDLGDPERFKTLAELVCEIHQMVYRYNHTRIHSRFRMSPVEFARSLSVGVSLSQF